MKLLFRQLCVFILLLLQVFAPLVHAHTDMQDSGSHVHIHNFHSHALMASSDSVESSQALQRLDVIINLNVAIKEKDDLSALFPYLYIQSTLWHDWQAQQLEQSTHFPPLFEASKACFTLSLIAPRAPPST